MRSDMAKVIVERPRYGSRDRGVTRKGYTKRLSRALTSDGGGPAREGMKEQHCATKRLNEHLGPLRRYLDKQVGRPWDKVFSDICQHIDRSNPVQDHVRDHVERYVTTNVVVINGELCHGGAGRYPRYGTPLLEANGFARWHSWYVCPKTGLLRKLPFKRRVPKQKPVPPQIVRVNDRMQCWLVRGKWELVALAPLPPELARQRSDEVDVVLGKSIATMTDKFARITYGALVYAVSRRVLGKREQRQYPIPIDQIR